MFSPRLLSAACCSTWFLALVFLSSNVTSFTSPPITPQRPEASIRHYNNINSKSNQNDYNHGKNDIILGHLARKDGGDGETRDNTVSTTTTSRKTTKTTSPSGEFAYQEMIVLLTAMRRQGATSKTMDPVKRNELEGYVRTVLATRVSEPLANIGKALLPTSEWKLLFSTSSIVLDSLPNDATVVLNILDSKRLEYTLQFSKKTLGLNSITANCHYTFDSGPVQPGLLTFVYDSITTNIMGFQNLPVGFFGLLKGRTNYVESAYFDGTFWIERGIDGGVENKEFINVYMRTDE